MTLAFAPERIEHWPLAHLQPYARNAKQHGADQVAKLAASMAEFGWTVPCLVAEDGELIAGHGRVLAAKQLGLTPSRSMVTFIVAPFIGLPLSACSTGGFVRHRSARTARSRTWAANPAVSRSWTSQPTIFRLKMSMMR